MQQHYEIGQKVLIKFIISGNKFEKETLTHATRIWAQRKYFSKNYRIFLKLLHENDWYLTKDTLKDRLTEYFKREKDAKIKTFKGTEEQVEAEINMLEEEHQKILKIYEEIIIAEEMDASFFSEGLRKISKIWKNLNYMLLEGEEITYETMLEDKELTQKINKKINELSEVAASPFDFHNETNLVYDDEFKYLMKSKKVIKILNNIEIFEDSFVGLHAETNSYKTQLMVTMAAFTIQHFPNENILFVSTETKNEMIKKRFLASDLNLPIMNTELLLANTHKTTEYPNMTLVFDTNYEINQLEVYINTFHPKVIFIDGCYKIISRESQIKNIKDERLQLKAIALELFEMSKRYNIAIITTWQANTTGDVFGAKQVAMELDEEFRFGLAKSTKEMPIRVIKSDLKHIRDRQLSMSEFKEQLDEVINELDTGRECTFRDLILIEHKKTRYNRVKIFLMKIDQKTYKIEHVTDEMEKLILRKIDCPELNYKNWFMEEINAPTN